MGEVLNEYAAFIQALATRTSECRLTRRFA